MKKLSIIFNVLLLLPAMVYLSHIMELYDDKGPLRVFGLTTHKITVMAMPYIILLTIYCLAILISMYLNIKKKYSINIPFSGVMIVIAMFMPLLINSKFVYALMDKYFNG